MFRSVFEKIRAISFAFMHINSAYFCPDPALKIAYRARHTKLRNKQSLHKNVLLCVKCNSKRLKYFSSIRNLKKEFSIQLDLKEQLHCFEEKQQQINKYSNWQKRGDMYFII